MAPVPRGVISLLEAIPRRSAARRAFTTSSESSNSFGGALAAAAAATASAAVAMAAFSLSLPPQVVSASGHPRGPQSAVGGDSIGTHAAPAGGAWRRVALAAESRSPAPAASPSSSSGGSSSGVRSGVSAAAMGNPSAPDPALAGSQGATSSDPSASGSPLSPLKLLQVHVLFRHGDRSPIPLDSHSPEEAKRWESRLQPRPSADLLPERIHSRGLEYPFGQLTVRGANQAQALGAVLRQRYADALGLAVPLAPGSPAAPPQGMNPSSPAGPSSGSPGAPWDRTLLLKQMEVRSTNFPRTYLSAFFVLKGLLGSEAAAGQVPIDIRQDKDENLYENDTCARGALLWGRAWRDHTGPHPGPDGAPRDVGWRGQHQNEKKDIATFFNIEHKPRFPWILALDNVVCRVVHGDPFPRTLTPDSVYAMRDHSARDYAHVFSIREIAKLAMGPLLWELHTRMDHCKHSPAAAAAAAESSKAAPAAVPLPALAVVSASAHTSGSSSSSASSSSSSSSSSSESWPSASGALGAMVAEALAPPRLFLYSGHDATLMPLAAALGVAPDTWPPYSSWMALELWGTHDNSQHFVRMIYNGDEVALPLSVPPSSATTSWNDPGPWQRGPVSVSGDPSGGFHREECTLCTWEQFSHLAAWAKMSPREYDDACKHSHSNL